MPRTPNSKCVLCPKLLYRRPSDLKKFRHVACFEHRSQAQKLSGITDAQRKGLSLGTVKGNNYRKGSHNSQASKEKVSKSNKEYWANHPDLAAQRGLKTRGHLHKNWKGGSSRLNTAIRRLTEYRKWADAVRERDVTCKCGASDELESHHKVELSVLINQHKIKNVQDARKCQELWDIGNGETLCVTCHFSKHGRTLKSNPQKIGG